MKLKEQKQNYCHSNVDNSFKRKKAFLSSVRDGRIFFCVSCHRQLHKIQVVELEDDWQESLEKQYPGSTAKYIGTVPDLNHYLPCLKGETSQIQKSSFVCHTCKKYIEQNRMPPMSNQNNLQLVDVTNHSELKLSELEQQLIALNLIFQKIVLLPKSRMSAMKDKS